MQLDLFSIELDELQTVTRERGKQADDATGEHLAATLELAEAMSIARERLTWDRDYGEWWAGVGLNYGRTWRSTLVQIGIRWRTEGRPSVQSLNTNGERFSLERYASGVDPYVGDATPDDGKDAHVAANSGNEEWYTNVELIEAAREAMGSIDCDPASNDIAQATVKAGVYYTKENSGLLKPWEGNVWLNPPYSKGLVDEFITKLLDERPAQWCVLTNNSSDTGWWQRLARASDATCMLAGRNWFYGPNGEKSAPLQGQTVNYHGENTSLFIEAFEQFGVVL